MYIVGVIASACAVLLLAVVNPDYFRHDVGDGDIMNDWVVAWAFLSGENPYSDLDELANRFSDGRYNPPVFDPEFEGTNRTPRTPGAIALSAIWVPIPVERLVHINNLIGALLLIPMIFVVIRGSQHPGWQTLSLVLFLTAAMLWSVRYSTITPLVAFASIFATVGINDGDKPISGVAIAVACTMKAFPLILLVLAGAYKRWSTFRWAMGSLVVLNLVPLLTPQIGLMEAIDALLRAPARYAHSGANTSLTRLISEVSDPAIGIVVFVAVILSVSWWIFSHPSNVATDGTILLGVGILFSPLYWPHYGLIFYPVALLFIFSPTSHVVARTVATASLLLAFPTGEPWIGAIGILLSTFVAVLQRARLSPPPRPLLVPVSAH